MSYRKITVNDVQYEYVVGKTHVKVKGLGVWPKTEVGQVVYVPEYCECCGEPLSEIYSSHIDATAVRVTPSEIKATILAHI